MSTLAVLTGSDSFLFPSSLTISSFSSFSGGIYESNDNSCENLATWAVSSNPSAGWVFVSETERIFLDCSKALKTMTEQQTNEISKLKPYNPVDPAKTRGLYLRHLRSDWLEDATQNIINHLQLNSPKSKRLGYRDAWNSGYSVCPTNFLRTNKITSDDAKPEFER